MESSSGGTISAADRADAGEHDGGSDEARHRWTVGKLVKRAVIGLVLLTSLIGGGAWMLHLGTSPGPSRNFDELLNRTIVFAEQPADLRRARASGVTAIVDRDLTSRLLRQPGGVWASHRPTAIDGEDHPVIATIAVTSFALASASTAQMPPKTRLYGTPKAILDRIVAAGFAGVVLDMNALDGAGFSNADLAARLSHAARHAHRLQPGFLVAVSGREDLIAHRYLVDAVDAFFKPRFLVGNNTGIANRNHRADYVASRHFLDRARRAGKAVLVAVASDSPADRAGIKRNLHALSYVPVIAASRPTYHASGADPSASKTSNASSDAFAADRMPFSNF